VNFFWPITVSIHGVPWGMKSYASHFSMEVVLENTDADNPLQPAFSEHICGSYAADIM